SQQTATQRPVVFYCRAFFSGCLPQQGFQFDDAWAKLSKIFIYLYCRTQPKYTMKDITQQYRNLPQLLLSARAPVMDHCRPVIRHFELTDQQWRVLRTVYEEKTIEPRMLCDKCQIVSASMAGVLARMADRDLIVRKPFPGDQRRALVKITPKGRKIVEQAIPLVAQQYRHIEEVLGSAQLETLVSVIDEFIQAEKNAAIQHVPLPTKTDS